MRKGEIVLETLKHSGVELPDGVTMVLEGIIEDNKKIGERMDKIEEKVNQVQTELITIKDSLNDTNKSIDRLVGLVENSIQRRENLSNIFADLIKNKMFWIWLIVLTALIFGVSVADLSGLFSIGG